jgi:hypothetical protein
MTGGRRRGKIYFFRDGLGEYGFRTNILIFTANGVWVVPLVLYLELQALYQLQGLGFEENLTFYIPVSLSQRLLYLNGLGASCAAPELGRNPLYLGLFVSRS